MKANGLKRKVNCLLLIPNDLKVEIQTNVLMGDD